MFSISKGKKVISKYLWPNCRFPGRYHFPSRFFLLPIQLNWFGLQFDRGNLPVVLQKNGPFRHRGHSLSNPNRAIYSQCWHQHATTWEKSENLEFLNEVQTFPDRTPWFLLKTRLWGVCLVKPLHMGFFVRILKTWREFRNQYLPYIISSHMNIIYTYQLMVNWWFGWLVLGF